MIVPTEQAAVEKLVRATRKTLAQQSSAPEHVGPMARVALSSFPDFIASFAAEQRVGTDPRYIESAVLTLCANMLLTLAHTAAFGNPMQPLPAVLQGYLDSFNQAYLQKAALLARSEDNEKPEPMPAVNGSELSQ